MVLTRVDVSVRLVVWRMLVRICQCFTNDADAESPKRAQCFDDPAVAVEHFGRFDRMRS